VSEKVIDAALTPALSADAASVLTDVAATTPVTNAAVSLQLLHQVPPLS